MRGRGCCNNFYSGWIEGGNRSLTLKGTSQCIFGGLLLILGGLLLALLLGWVVPGRFQKDLSESSTPQLQQRLLLLMLRWVSPPVVATGLVISVVDLLKG